MLAGRIGVPQHRFWQMTPREFWYARLGYEQRLEDRHWETAWLACTVLNPFLDKQITPKQLVTGRLHPDAETREGYEQMLEDHGWN